MKTKDWLRLVLFCFIMNRNGENKSLPKCAQCDNFYVGKKRTKCLAGHWGILLREKCTDYEYFDIYPEFE